MSYNFGAGNKDRVKKAFFTQFKVCTIFTTLFCIIVITFPRLFAGIFSNITELITYTAWASKIYYGRNLFPRFSSLLPAKFYGSWAGKGQSVACLFKKTDFIDSFNLYPATFYPE